MDVHTKISRQARKGQMQIVQKYDRNKELLIEQIEFLQKVISDALAA